MADSCRYRLGVSPRFTLLHSAPLSGIEVLTGIITGVCRKEVVSILQRKQRNVAALMFKAFRRKECHGKGKNHKGRQRIGLRKDGQGNLLHPRSHPRCNQAAPCVCVSVQPPHQTGQRCGSIGCSFFTSFKRKGPAPHGVEPFSKLFNYFKILHGSGLFIQHELSINRLLFQAFHLLAL